ncbi:hypothetical protein [Streptomyces sp. NPDC093984]|uniref:hypothetical protein n=1 Tax=Streptomyces sp. NPDC093984 TaxID=3366052 RepID=UPI003817E049
MHGSLAANLAAQAQDSPPAGGLAAMGAFIVLVGCCFLVMARRWKRMEDEPRVGRLFAGPRLAAARTAYLVVGWSVLAFGAFVLLVAVGVAAAGKTG